MKDCIFCKIIRGELPSFKVYEDEKVLAILDIHPVHAGHTLVMPKHFASKNIFDVPTEDWLAMAKVAQMLARAVEKATNADGINLMMNNRANAGQLVDHPHIHIIPRFKEDGLKHWRQSSYKDGEADAVKEKIRAAL